MEREADGVLGNLFFSPTSVPKRPALFLPGLRKRGDNALWGVGACRRGIHCTGLGAFTRDTSKRGSIIERVELVEGGGSHKGGGGVPLLESVPFVLRHITQRRIKSDMQDGGGEIGSLESLIATYGCY